MTVWGDLRHAVRAASHDAREHEVIAEIDELRQRLRSRLYEPRRWTGLLAPSAIRPRSAGSNSIEGYEAKLDDALAIEMGEEALDASEETALAIRATAMR